ncbi:MAG: hypothetical protein LBB18_02670, partial [Puniceicoccales bacterium]|nr:hypothetical protein [Puniceicoccales bacterium]
MKNLVRFLVCISVIVWMGVPRADGFSGNGVFLSVKVKSPNEMNARLRAASLAIFGREFVQKSVDPVLDFLCSAKCGLSKSDNVGLYFIPLKPEKVMAPGQLVAESEPLDEKSVPENGGSGQENGDLPTPTETVAFNPVFLVKTGEGRLAKSIVRLLLGECGTREVEIDGWTLFCGDERIAKDREFGRSLVADVSEKIVDDAVFKLNTGAGWSEFADVADSVPFFVCDGVPHKFTDCVESVSWALRFDAERMFLTKRMVM